MDLLSVVPKTKVMIQVGDINLGRCLIEINPKNLRRISLNSHKIKSEQKWRKWADLGTAKTEANPGQSQCWQDFEEFRLKVCKHKTYPHQRVWEDLLNTDEDSRCLKGIAGKDLLILSPRGSTKSTFLAEWIAWQIGLHTAPWVKISPRILLISYDISTAASKSRQIQAILTIEEYQKIFPWVRPSPKKWGEREWAVDFEFAGLSTTEEQYTICCAGLKGAINSRRASLVIVDDVIKSREDITSTNVREKMVDNWNRVIRFTRYDGSRAICLGTRFTASDIYCTTFIPPRWEVVEQSALLTHDNGTEYSYWEPEGKGLPGQPLAMLQKEREEDPVTFSYQRQNKIVRIATQSINPEQIIRGILPLLFETFVLGVDLSAGLKESNDYTSIVLGGLYRDGESTQYWIIDCWEDRVMGNIEKLDAIAEIWDMWKHLLPQGQRYNGETQQWEPYPLVCPEIWFDSSAYGLSLKGDFEDHIVKRLGILDFLIRPIPASGRGGKLERLRKHTGLFHSKSIRFNTYGRTMPDGRKPLGRLIQQITEFGSTSHDDLADAFDLCISGLRQGGLPMTKGNY